MNEQFNFVFEFNGILQPKNTKVQHVCNCYTIT